MPVVETFFGYVETTKDSLLILEACRQGCLPRVMRRLQEQERPLVKSGAVFCFDENESGIKRWTDGLVWSPSRIHGNFLIYRELDDHRQPEQQQANDKVQLITSGLTLVSKRQRERHVASRQSYRFKDNGLIKKSLSLVVNGVHQHLISYYNKDDINKFKTPSDIPELAALTLSPELLDAQHFRIPFLLDGDKRPATRQKKRSNRNNPSRRNKAIVPRHSVDASTTTQPLADQSTLPHTLTLIKEQQADGSGIQLPQQTVSHGFGSDHHHQWVPHSFSTGYSIDRHDQNPHQHLFSSSSFHAINHAAIPNRTPELVSNAFMLDINALFGSGWNDFEIQM